MVKSSSAAAAEHATRRLGLAVGIALGVAGATWILVGHERPGYALWYHVPLAVMFGAWAVAVATGRGRLAGVVTTALALGLVVLRIAWPPWPLSGHGVLAAMIAASPTWRGLRIAGGAILVQAFATKWLFDRSPESVVYGAAAGLLLAWLGRRLRG